MDRLKAIVLLMKQKGLRKYLEIGVFNGHILFKIQSTFKIAVDPDFAFDNARKLGKIFLNPFNLFNKYFEKKSDDFFATDATNVIGANKIDISLIDGMHEYGFALRDMENVLLYLRDIVTVLNYFEY